MDTEESPAAPDPTLAGPRQPTAADSPQSSQCASGFFQGTPLADYESVTHILAGGIGGGTTAAIATPFDTIKVRMQTQVAGAEPHVSEYQ